MMASSSPATSSKDKLSRQTMKTRLVLLHAALFAASGLALQAQVFTPQSTGGGQQTGNSGGPQNTTTVITEDNSNKGDENIMGNVLPLFDPSSETMMFEGQMWDINDNRVFNARFEKYLNSPPAMSEDDIAYRETIDGIRQALSPHNKQRGGRPDMQRAVALLEQASRFRQDSRMSESLANAIYRVWLARKSVENLEKANERLRKERKVAVRNSEIIGEGSKLSGSSSSNEEDEQAKAQAGDTVSRLTLLGEEATRYAEIQGKITANEGKIAISDVQSRLEFQSLIVQFFMQRRFEHVIIAARLYTEFYSDGAGKIDFKEGSDAEKMFKETAGFDPTVTTLDTLANEAIQDTKDAVVAFDYLIEKDERASASKRLMEGFVVGEHLPPIQTVSLEKKQSILTFVRTYNQLLSAMEVKDYELAEENTDELRKLAGDFDHSKPMAAINIAKTTSSMHIQTAVNAALTGDTKTFQDNIGAATQIWPTNPELKRAFDQTSEMGNVQIQTVNDLDRLIATRSYRQIYNDKARYIGAVGMTKDTERQDALEQIIGNITKIDIAIQQAQKLEQVGNSYGAWETVEEVFKEFPDDPPLSKARSDYATEVASFVSALKKAEELEERDQHGSSLAWFLKSRQMYPASYFAAQGIGRLVEEVLPDSTGGTGLE